MLAMDQDEKDICNYLRTGGDLFVSAREIARRAGGKWRYRENPGWATPVLLRLVEKGILESDAAGYYRLRPKKTKKPQKWIAPHIKAILEKSEKNFGDILEADEHGDFYR
jgi:hypothetical protein